jgi:hypothetical protein
VMDELEVRMVISSVDFFSLKIDSKIPPRKKN